MQLNEVVEEFDLELLYLHHLEVLSDLSVLLPREEVNDRDAKYHIGKEPHVPNENGDPPICPYSDVQQ